MRRPRYETLVDVIGIDPGINGAIAKFNSTKATLNIWDMPILEVNKKKTISPYLVANILKEAAAPVFIEKVAAMPGQGVTSMFNFGKGFGVLLGAAAGLGLQAPQGKRYNASGVKTLIANVLASCFLIMLVCSLEGKMMVEQMQLYWLITPFFLLKVLIIVGRIHQHEWFCNT